MDYKLAKSLKDAGFLQIIEDSTWIWEAGFERWQLACKNPLKKDLDFVIRPTLSELIDACGDKFGNLTKLDKGEKSGKAIRDEDGQRVPGGFEASSIESMEEPYEYLWEWGKTPEEAVARLWLTLNKEVDK